MGKSGEDAPVVKATSEGAERGAEMVQPLISVVILNYNGKDWLTRCLASIKEQSLISQTEVIVVDNASSDGSDKLAEELLQNWEQTRFVGHKENLGFCEGNNRGAAVATGKYLFFLNNDTWLEPDCLRNLCAEMDRNQAGAGGALVLNYDDNSFQSVGGTGMDWLGFPDAAPPITQTTELFATCGCAYVIRRDLFERVGGFDAQFFLYWDENDLSWRVWIAGYRIIGIPSARVHHRGAVAVNPKGGTQMVEWRTSATKRFYVNRNAFLYLLKNAQNLFLLMLPLHLGYFAIEALGAYILTKNATFVRKAYFAAVKDCWRLRGHVRRSRRLIRSFRKRSDLSFLPFIKIIPSRLSEIRRIRKEGKPKISAQ